MVSFLWAVITTAVTLFALFVLCVVGFDSDITFMAIRQFLRSETFDFMTIFFFLPDISIPSWQSMPLSAWGQFVRDHRVIASIAFYAAIYTVQQIVSLVVLIPVRSVPTFFQKQPH